MRVNDLKCSHQTEVSVDTRYHHLPLIQVRIDVWLINLIIFIHSFINVQANDVLGPSSEADNSLLSYGLAVGLSVDPPNLPGIIPCQRICQGDWVLILKPQDKRQEECNHQGHLNLPYH